MYIIFLGFLQIFIKLEMRKLLPVQLTEFLISMLVFTVLYHGLFSSASILWILFLTKAYLLIPITILTIVQMSWNKSSAYSEQEFTPRHPLYFYVPQCNELFSLSGLWYLWVFVLSWYLLALIPNPASIQKVPSNSPWQMPWHQMYFSCAIQAIQLSLSGSKSLWSLFFSSSVGHTVMVASSHRYNNVILELPKSQFQNTSKEWEQSQI